MKSLGLSGALGVAVWIATACGGRSDHAPAPTSDGGLRGNGGNDGGAGTPNANCLCPAPRDDVWIADDACVYGADGVSCATRLEEALGSLVATTGGLWAQGCGRSTVTAAASDRPPIACVYDSSGALLGASRANPSECPGVTTVTTSADLACSDETACWLGPGGTDKTARCTQPNDFLSQACLDFGTAGIAPAFQSLGYQGATLDEFVATITKQQLTTEYTVAVGCGLTAFVARGLGSSVVTFDAQGAMVGFQFSGDQSYGPCDVYGYRRGVLPPDGCDSGYHTCPFAADAVRTGQACACPCPDALPEGGVVTTTSDCVTPANQPACGAIENDEVVLLYQTGGWVSTGCDYVTTTRLVYDPFHDAKGELECLYDPSGALVHATRSDAPNSGCPGVTAWTTGTPPLVECPATRCWRGAGPTPDASPRCN